MMRILVVGAGFAGAVHARVLAEAGHEVEVIDRRRHIGGNAYDEVDENGVRVHLYGPHLFHTRSRRVLDWIRRFGTFAPYTHKVRALLSDGRFVPLPINLQTVNEVLGSACTTAEEVESVLARVALPIAEPRNAAEHLYSRIGRELTDLFFRPYTKKMWALDLEEMSPAVVKRIPLRTDRTDTYFPDDDVQIMPSDGYAAVFGAIFDHPKIRVRLNTSFEAAMLRDCGACFNSMAIDEYYGYCFGELPYRSIRFHSRSVPTPLPQGWSVTNFTDNGPFTRETAWHEIPHHLVRETGLRTLTREEPCDYLDNQHERYYPVRTADDRYQALYEKYRRLAAREPKLRFTGRCGTYQYLDMDQVINQSLASAEKWLADKS